MAPQFTPPSFIRPKWDESIRGTNWHTDHGIHADFARHDYGKTYVLNILPSLIYLLDVVSVSAECKNTEGLNVIRQCTSAHRSMP